MKRPHAEDEYLALSGLQHYAFCPRQWALIHLEQQWAENERTVDGEHVHRRCHDESIREHRGDVLIVRGLRVASERLGLFGVCDVVEFTRADEGAMLFGERGTWVPVPVEYKRGEPKAGDADRIQACAQAMALEEMFCCVVPRAYLFYDAVRRRERIELDESLRASTIAMSERMHDSFVRGVTPPPVRGKACSACSLRDACLPELGQARTVELYMDSMIGSSPW